MRRCDYCGEPLARERRSDARYCDGLCRGRKYRGIPRETLTNGNARTPDKGTRVYLTPDDLADLELQLPHLSITVARKIKEARTRIERSSNGDRNSGATTASASSRTG